MLSPVKEGKWRGQMKPAGEVVLEAIENSSNAILRDYALVIAVLAMGAKSKVGGLKEFCALAARHRVLPNIAWVGSQLLANELRLPALAAFNLRCVRLL